MTPGSRGTIFIPGGYYSYGYGYYSPFLYGLGYGAYSYYGGYYDPWYGGYPSYGYPAYDPYGYGGYTAPPDGGYASPTGGEGTLRLKVKPRDAEVFVDGNYVGIVDDFNGIFHHLHVESGAHHVEVRAAGYESLTFDVRVTPGHTTTYQGELRRIQ
jgi:hypothetical protein